MLPWARLLDTKFMGERIALVVDPESARGGKWGLDNANDEEMKVLVLVVGIRVILASALIYIHLGVLGRFAPSVYTCLD